MSDWLESTSKNSQMKLKQNVTFAAPTSNAAAIDLARQTTALSNIEKHFFSKYGEIITNFGYK